MGSRFVEALAALVRLTGHSPAPDFHDRVRKKMASVAMGIGEEVPSYFHEVLGRLEQGTPTTGWADVPADEQGLSWVFKDLSSFIPGATYQDNGTHAEFSVPHSRVKAIIELTNNLERYTVVPATKALASTGVPVPVPHVVVPSVSYAQELLVEGGFDPDEATVRRWAYDVNRRLTSQDEDLALQQERYFPLLIELASDPACPKADYILRIIDGFLASRLIYGSWRPLTPFLQARDFALQAPIPAVRAWGEHATRLLDYFSKRGEVSLPEATSLARELLVGIYRPACDIQLIDETDGWWAFVLTGTAMPYPARLYVHQPSGTLVYTQWGTPEPSELAAYAKAPPRGPYLKGQPAPTASE